MRFLASMCPYVASLVFKTMKSFVAEWTFVWTGPARYAGRAYPGHLPYPWVGEGHLDRSGSGIDFGRVRGKTLDVEGIAGRELAEVAMIYRSRRQPAALRTKGAGVMQGVS